MTQKLIKPIVRVGNSAGIVLPKEWYGGKARVELIKKPLNIKKEVLEILEQYLCDVQGIYLVGSYAREEQTEKSDVDILVITNKINKKVEQGKYNIILVSQKNVEDSLRNNVLPLLPMLKESKSILNDNLILDYKKTGLTKKNLKWHIETTKSAMKLAKESLKVSKEVNTNAGSAVAYSLVLRLRTFYIIDCLIKNKKWSNNEFIKVIKRISGSSDAYGDYLAVKNNLKEKSKLTIIEAEKLVQYLGEWLKKIKRLLSKKS